MHQFLYHLVAFITVAIWGTTFISSKFLLIEGLTPAQAFFFRFLLSWIGMILVYPRRFFCDNIKDELLMVLAGVSGGSIYFLAENTSLQYAPTNVVSFIVCMAPLVTAVLAAALPNSEKPSRQLWVGSFIALAGVFFVLQNDNAPSVRSNLLLGAGLAWVSAFVWAIYQLICKPLSDKYGVMLLTRKIFGYGVLTVLPVILYEGSIPLSTLTKPVVWGNILFLGLLCSWICFLVWNVIIRKLGSIISSNYIYLNPLVTCICSYYFLNEKLTPMMIFGGVLILVGIFLAVKPKRHVSNR